MDGIRKYWWVLFTRALLLLIIGVIAVTAPNMPLETLVFYLGFLSLAMLLLSITLMYLLFKERWRWVPFSILAIFDAVLSYYCLFQTSIASQAFLTSISVLAVFMGLGLLVMALKQKGLGMMVFVMNGALSLVFVGFVFFNPLKTTSVNFMIGFYTLLLSFFLLYLSIRIYKLPAPGEAKPPKNQAKR